ncbi:hypothetical protein TSUD_77570 [Trifolium subterraneum]|uniref:Retrotransposon Copia-like N-terminal domain-containing protein n=1 Tax=Trifolium subterraneum TaxID=3900 RepID=A0A2Z6MBJ5_TRISU|nr:hypothetical protein TSUD_77570 [Trifolium subterraneum]
MSSLSEVVSSVDKLIILNAGSQLCIKLDGDNYPAWRIQFMALLTGYDLIGYVDGTKPCPSKHLANNTTAINPAFTHWVRQDQLILHGIVSSVAATVVTHLGTIKNSNQAWEILKTMYVGRSRPLDETDLVIHTLNGLTVEYREISAALRSRESPVIFAELHEKLMDFETIHHQADPSAVNNVIATANVVTRNRSYQHKNNNNRSTSPTLQNGENKVDLQQLTLANSYPGADRVIVGDGTCLNITHTGLELGSSTAPRSA